MLDDISYLVVENSASRWSSSYHIEPGFRCLFFTNQESVVEDRLRVRGSCGKTVDAEISDV